MNALLYFIGLIKKAEHELTNSYLSSTCQNTNPSWKILWLFLVFQLAALARSPPSPHICQAEYEEYLARRHFL